MTILIDADGCPVVDVTIKVAKEYELDCIILCDTAHSIQREGAKTITVSKGADSVDFALINRVKPGDVVITQDYGLASMCLARRAVPVRQDGLVYSNDNIDMLLQERHTAKKIRMSGGRLKGSSKRQPKDDAEYEMALRRVLTRKD